jgi:hypothetical protein
MSTALGIASVTQILKNLLNDGVIDNDVSGNIGNIQVSSLAPSQVEGQSEKIPTQLNIFLYRVSHNTGWNNAGYPSRNANGDLLSNPPLALDLHYLLTAYGESELHAEILLGYGMQWLHEHPVLDRAQIKSWLRNITDGGSLHSDLMKLATSGLADQIEQIKITPEPLNTEEMSKLWTAFQAKYRPCTAYLASVVLIESEKPIRSTLPVKERKLYVIPFRQPVIEKILSQELPNGPIRENQPVLVGHILILQGRQLKSENVIIRINGQDYSNLAKISDTQISFELPDTIKAGVQGVQVIHRIEMGNPPEYREAAASNLQAFVLSPQINKLTIQNLTKESTAEITLTIHPPFQKGQQVSLVLSDPPTPSTLGQTYVVPIPEEIMLKSLDGEASGYPVPEMKNGTYLARVRVDGAESPLFDSDNDGIPDTPKIKIEIV